MAFSLKFNFQDKTAKNTVIFLEKNALNRIQWNVQTRCSQKETLCLDMNHRLYYKNWLDIEYVR